jgi:DNA-binding NarL/FixJ family response regulator
MDTISVLVVDDHPIVRQGLIGLLGREKDIQIVGEAADGVEALEMIRERDPEVIVMDLAMPKKNGLLATRALLKENRRRKVIVLSMSDDTQSIEQAIQSGVSGYVLKQSATNELLTAIREVHKGNAFFSPPVARVLLSIQTHTGSDGAELTLREQEVLQLIAEGQSNKQISIVLEISVKTVEKYRQKIMDKLNIHEVVGLTRYAIAHQIVKL